MDSETLKVILPVVGTLLGAATGGVITYFITRANQLHQLVQDDVKDIRALRDAKRARLTAIYETALVALVKMDHFVSVHHLGESSAEQLASVFASVDEARAHLMVEPDAELIAQQFEQLFRAFTAIRIIQGERIGDPQIRLTDVQRRQDEFAQKSAAVREAIHAS